MTAVRSSLSTQIASVAPIKVGALRSCTGAAGEAQTLVTNSYLGINAGGLLVQHALLAAHLTSSEVAPTALVLKGLSSLRGDTLGGLAPPLTFKKDTDHSLNCWYESRWLNGKPVLVNGGKAVRTAS